MVTLILNLINLELLELVIFQMRIISRLWTFAVLINQNHKLEAPNIEILNYVGFFLFVRLSVFCFVLFLRGWGGTRQLWSEVQTGHP